MDPIKEAFSKIKEEMTTLREDISVLRKALLELYELQHTTMLTPNQTDNPTQNPTHSLSQSSLPTQQTDQQTITQVDEEKNRAFKAPISQNIVVSTGNKGVPTDSQTDEQTVRQTNRQPDNWTNNSLMNVNIVLESLDSIKKELRLKFKRLTPQEMAVFEQVYLLDVQQVSEITYKLLSQRLQLSESSTREYCIKLIKKGIPLEKIKVNNKLVLLKIPLELKKIASLETIIRLRDL